MGERREGWGVQWEKRGGEGRGLAKEMEWGKIEKEEGGIGEGSV